MKQLMQNIKTGATEIVEVPIPAAKPGFVLVRTAVSLVSAGTERMVVEFAEKSLLGKARSRPDLVKQVLDKARREGLLTTIENAFNRLEEPMPLGYSSSGTIVKLGEGISGFKIGDRVACAGGGYAVHAEYAQVPRNLLASLPESVDFESAAFATLGAIAMHGYRLAGVQIGERVAVIGLGLVGLLAAGIAQAAGCDVFGVDLNESRLALANQLGIKAVSRAEAEEAGLGFSQGMGFDGVLICADTSSADPVELAGVMARDRAKVVATGAVGLSLPRKIYYEKELTFINSRSYGPGRYDPVYEEKGQDYPAGYVRWSEGRNLQAFIRLVEEGKLDVKRLITHRIPFGEANRAYDLITGKRSESFLGIVLTYAPESLDGNDPVRLSTLQAKQGAQPLQRITQPVSAVRLGVLGAGNFARVVMLPVLKRLPVERLVLASASGASAQSAAAKFGFQRAMAEESEVLDDPEVNTVAILTRHNLHASQVLAALKQGKHVFCEKPLALHDNEVDAIQAALAKQAGENKPLLMVGFNRRFAPMLVEIKQFLSKRSEPLVAHYRINAGSIPLNHWTQDPEQGGGRLLGEACHFIDALTFLIGSAPLKVFTQALPDGGRYREDNFILSLVYPDGSLGTVGYLANGDKSVPKERLEVFCSGQVVLLDDFRRLELVSGGKRRTIRSRLRQDKGHEAEWKAFVQAILAGGPPPIPYDQLFGVTRASLAGLKSLHSGEWVQLQS